VRLTPYGFAFGPKQRLAFATRSQPLIRRTAIAMGASDSRAARSDGEWQRSGTDTIRLVKKQKRKEIRLFAFFSQYCRLEVSDGLYLIRALILPEALAHLIEEEAWCEIALLECGLFAFFC
jgi:hypothetical protein